MRAITLYLIMFLALLMLSACGSIDTLIYSGSNSNPSVLVSAEQIGSIDSVDAINKAYLNSDAGKMTVSTTLGGYGTVSKATTAGATTILPSIDIIKIIETVWNNAGFAPYFRTPYASFYKITYISLANSVAKRDIAVNPSNGGFKKILSVTNGIL